MRIGGIVRLNEEAVAVKHGAAVFILGGRHMPSAMRRSKFIVQLIPTFCCRQAGYFTSRKCNNCGNKCTMSDFLLAPIE